ncbi:alpha/beta fold hydrolase [Roseovarius sp. SYSU LYC5161]|uniref:alpha/beta fold hydrolase n=1 Tax=Roseovarius halophilus (ex Wu et al. 2025) TaxID=3376060 RepID=UPI00287111EE|nr:alpha/beta hydrolase [Roseovarius sp.]
MPYGEKAGVTTFWKSLGRGARPALALHCSLSSSASFASLADVLVDDFTITAFDLPGHGRSADWDGQGEIQRLTMEIAKEFLSEQGSAHVIGHSFGATVALRLAVAWPALVRSLVLVEPVFFAVARTDHPALHRAHLERMSVCTRAIEAGDNPAAARAFLGEWGDGTPWSGLPREQRAAFAKRMPLVAAAEGALNDDPAGLLSPGALSTLDLPVLLMEGSLSPAIVGVIQEGLATRLPRAERTVIMDAGHMAPVTHPVQVGDEIRRFVTRSCGLARGAP